MRINMRHAGLTGLLGIFFLLCCACDIAHAEITVRDNWVQAGNLSIEGVGWTASFRKDDAAVALTSDNQVVRIVPFDDAGVEADAIVSCELGQANSKEQVEVHAVFSTGDKRLTSSFHFTRDGTVRLRSADAMRGVIVRSPVAVGVLPGIQLEDILYRPEDYRGLNEVHVPAENWFAGLLDGNDGIVVCAWPDGGQTLSLMQQGDAAKPVFGAIKIELAGEELYLGLLTGSAIWHREKLELGYLERDIEIEWKRPFPATYKTQLLLRGETTIPRTFVFQKKRFTQYRPEVGDSAWPVWFEGDRAFMRLSKKVPPRGEAIIYPMEDGAKTLMGFVRRTPVADIIVRRNTRADLPHGPREADNVGFVACGGTGLIRRTIFMMGLQHREKEFLTEYADFLADYVAIVQKRHAGYFRFIDETRTKLAAWLEERGDDPGVRDYLEQMIQQADRTEEDLWIKMEFYDGKTPEEHIARGDRAAERLKELLDTAGTEVSPECEKLIDTCNMLAWGHAESAGMRFSMLAREWAEKAASACADKPKAMEYARTIRDAIRDALNSAPPW